MGLIKVLPEHKKRKRSKRGEEKGTTDKKVGNPAPTGQKQNPYFDNKEVHVTVGEGGVEISERPKNHEENIEQEMVSQKSESTSETSFNEEILKSLSNMEGATVQENPLMEVEEATIIVPETFMTWLESTDRSQGVLKSYSLLVNEGEQEAIEWVDNHQDEFMLIWKGELIPEVEEPLYETAMFNYGKYPNVLVKTLEGKVMMKTYEDMLTTDEPHLTEEEIREDWNFLFENGFSKRVE